MRDYKSRNTRNERGLCFMKDCRNKPAVEITFFGVKRIVCKPHKNLDGCK